MTDQSITQIEFQRFQDQLIALKENKYKTEEKCEHLSRNVTNLEMKCAHLERELLKANEFKTKVRSGKELEVLLDDNQILRDRMSATEANFKLQNAVLRTECESLLSENERLKCQIDTCKSANEVISECDDEIDGTARDEQQYKVRSLQFEVVKLIEEKGRIEGSNIKFRNEIDNLQRKENELAGRVDGLLNEKSKLMLENEKLKEVRVEDRERYICEKETMLQNYQEMLRVAQLAHEEELESMRTLAATKVNEVDELHLIRIKEFEGRLDRLNFEINAHERKYEAAVDDWQLKIDSVVEEWKLKMTESDQTHQKIIEEIAANNDVIVTSLESEVTRLKDSLHFAEEELKLFEKKNHRLLKDVKKQLEKEVKQSHEAQCRIEAQSSENSQTSQTRINEYLGSHQMYNTGTGDDQSSLHSSSTNGLLIDGQWSGSSSSIAVTDEELRNLLDRLTNVQNDHCEFKRKIDILNQEKTKLIQTIKRQENIILNYIKNRGGTDSCDISPDHSRRGQSTSEALTLNGLMSSPVHSKTSISSLLTKVKDTLKSMNPQDMLPLSGDKFSYRVTDGDVKQLQRVCEELMMRCLNLESDLQLAVDLNVKLTSQLETQR